MKSVVISILLLTCAASAMATGESLQLVGEARLKVLLWSVYHSRLYSKTGNYNPEQWLDTLLKIWPDVAEDDVLTLYLDEQGQSVFYSNGELLGQIEDPDFGVHFLDIWLSPATSRPGLREALLGQL